MLHRFMAAGAFLTVVFAQSLHASLVVISDVRSISVSGSAKATAFGPITESYSWSDGSTVPLADFHSNLSGHAGNAASGASSAQQDSVVTANSATYRSQLNVGVSPGFGFPLSECAASADSAFHLGFTVPSELPYSLAFDVGFGGSGSYVFPIPIAWSFSFRSTNLGVIQSGSVSLGRNSSGAQGGYPGYGQFAYAGLLHPSDIYTIEFTQHFDSEAITDQTVGQLTSSMTLTVVPEPAPGFVWGVVLLGVCISIRRRIAGFRRDSMNLSRATSPFRAP